MSTAHEGEPDGAPAPIPTLFANLVDDTTLLLPKQLRPAMSEVAAHYLNARDSEYGGLVGQLVCPVSRLSELVSELVKLHPTAPVDISLVVDTGLGAVPKALSLALSRDLLLTPRTLETAAPPDVDGVWLERVSEFVPDDMVPVVEPRRPLEGDTEQWLTAVRRVAEHGCTPKLRCGGPRASDVPSDSDVAAFLEAADGAPAGFTTSLGLPHVVRRIDEATGQLQHGMLNMLVAVARALVNGDVRGALAETDADVLAKEIGKLSDAAGGAVRGLLARCGSGRVAVPGAELATLGLLS
ncbi:hypothetical protein [Pseudonocardia spinosispora]|uniref:hypothetical protein n=1 Tax=Pseudonocardia spinosispora TaxID=103441 RepID=UPI0004219627|nr:hypothetical protein [Pseudonocardia spinosispora]